MASFQPFEPAIKSATAGQTVSVTVSTTVSTFLTQVVSSTAENPCILLSVFNPNGFPVVGYVRISTESSTIIAPTITDTPVPVPANGGYVRLFANPAPLGTTNIAVLLSVAPSTSGPIFYFTPGQGGDV